MARAFPPGRPLEVPPLHSVSLRLRNFKVFPGFTKDFSFHVPPQRANPGEHVMLAEIREREPKGKTWARERHGFQASHSIFGFVRS